MTDQNQPDAVLSRRDDGWYEVVLTGEWTLARLIPRWDRLNADLARCATESRVFWHCDGIVRLDSGGAMLLWRTWKRALPPDISMRPEHRHVLDRMDLADNSLAAEIIPIVRAVWLRRVGLGMLVLLQHLFGFTALIGQLCLDILHMLRWPRDVPRLEIFANLFKGGVRAMPVTAMVGFLIGIALSYLSALQLKQLGAEVFIVNILGVGIIRELGPMIVAVLIAGRSGSAMTAQLGVMRVTEEIDALSVMGVSYSLRLVLPKVIALGIAMPLLVLWACAIALLGGMVAAQVQLDISYGFFMESLPKVVPIANLWIGLGKGLVFGLLIAMVACYFGLRVRPNTESLSSNTTASVVTSITLVILVDAVIAIATRSIGMQI